METIELLIKDINENFTYFCPCAGWDFNMVTKIIETNENIFDNFVFIDSNTEGRYGWFTPIEFLDNKIGLAGLEIRSKEIEELDDDLINDMKINSGYSDDENYTEYIKNIDNPSIIRYILKYGDKEIKLYYIYFEALTLLNWLKSKIKIQEIAIGLIINAPGGGWIDADTLSARLINICPYFEITHWNSIQLDGFESPEHFGCNLWLSSKNRFIKIK